VRRTNPTTIPIREQIIEDEVSGITIIVELTGAGTGRLRILGDVPFGNRDFTFDADGQHIGTATSVHSGERSWMRIVNATRPFAPRAS
jgi:hypothetical protein